MYKIIYLNDNWKLKIGDNHSKSTPDFIKKIKDIPAEVPGTVHTTLLKNNLIEDPFYSDNEIKMRWISESDWIYQTTFDFPSENKKNSLPVKLVFEGIDTIARIYFNNVLLGSTSNMFLKYEYDITKLIKPENNELTLHFTSPVNYAIEQENIHGKLPVALESHRVYIRKAQYSFGWDWGPSFPTMGIWKNVYLKCESKAEVENIFFNTLEITNNYAVVEILFSVNKNSDEEISASIKFADKNYVIQTARNINRVIFKVENPKLWMPAGYGEQNLYEIEVILFNKHNEILNSITRKVGIRKIELQLKDDDKNTFRFLVNGEKIFAKGVNWIPADSFLTRVKKDTYHKLITYAKDANVNFIRVWGGGIYEDDYFYNLCDELGILVWQDFMFACAAYPEHHDFLNNIENEILYNVSRLQYHPSIAIWCGNNENEWIWYQEQKCSYKKMPGYKIFSKIIPKILKKIDPFRPYWESSPFGFDEDPNSVNSGNRHQWEIWSRWIDYNYVKYDNSLFVTEFGFQAPANQSTLEKVIPEEERRINSRIFEFHNKQIEGNERLIKFLISHLPLSNKWDEFIYLTQLNQGLALKTCIEHWRFNQPKTNGTIIWQLNDTWPVVSWSLIDSELIPKLSYYFVKEAFSEIALKFIADDKEISIIGLNQRKNKFSGKLNLLIINSNNGDVVFEKNKSIVIKENSIHNILSLNNRFKQSDILIATLYDDNNKQVFRNFYTFNEWKYIKLPETKINFELKNQNQENYLDITTDKPAFFVDIVISGAILEERGFIIVPGETKLIKVNNLQNSKINKKNVSVFCLNQFLCK
ncbi:glycoside hydrolase family 2 protein [Rosettibacter firmus]|uniref:glycoside hydrolase family 2 protein n=1 Tax=Rosettibacter firmus TaxID=3111522 RepID=UPI00336C1C45